MIAITIFFFSHLHIFLQTVLQFTPSLMTESGKTPNH